jgi:hypothetical protein
MIKFEHGGNRYAIRFSYDMDGRPTTACRINCKPNSNDDPKDLGSCLTVALARCDSRDNFSRAKGRKLTLTKALGECKISDSEDFCRAFRRAAWQAYLDTVRGGKHYLATVVKSESNKAK